jgi:hypothetical protein
MKKSRSVPVIDSQSTINGCETSKKWMFTIFLLWFLLARFSRVVLTVLLRSLSSNSQQKPQSVLRLVLKVPCLSLMKSILIENCALSFWCRVKFPRMFVHEFSSKIISKTQLAKWHAELLLTFPSYVKCEKPKRRWEEKWACLDDSLKAQLIAFDNLICAPQMCQLWYLMKATHYDLHGILISFSC